MSSKKDTQQSGGFTDEERAAMKEHLKEQKAAARRDPTANREEAENEVLAKIAEMPEPDRTLGERFHALIKANAPDLSPRLWYGMPAYAKNGKVVCHFQNASKFKTRYATVGFSEEAHLDDGMVWPVAFAVKELDAAEETMLSALVRKAVS